MTDGTVVDCGHDPAVGYAVEFVVREDADGIESACSMRATVHECDPEAEICERVGCAVTDCENYHERVATRLREHAARHSGNVSGEQSDR